MEAGVRQTPGTVRLMAPFSMRCERCGDFVPKGRKFNARKETLLPAGAAASAGLKTHRFRVRCPGCSAELCWRTDPLRGDYVCEAGVRRLYEEMRARGAPAAADAGADADDRVGRAELRAQTHRAEAEVDAEIEALRVHRAAIDAAALGAAHRGAVEQRADGPAGGGLREGAAIGASGVSAGDHPADAPGSGVVKDQSAPASPASTAPAPPQRLSIAERRAAMGIVLRKK